MLFNSIAMLFIGRLVEQLYGRLVLLGAFLITAIAGGLFWVFVAMLVFAVFQLLGTALMVRGKSQEPISRTEAFEAIAG